MRNYLLFMKKYIGMMRQLYTLYIIVINFLTENNTMDKINNSDMLSQNLSKIHDLYKSMSELNFKSPIDIDTSIYNKFNKKIEEACNQIIINKEILYKLYKNGTSTKVCSNLDINDTKINIFLNNIKNYTTNNTNITEIDFESFSIKMSLDNKSKITNFFDINQEISKITDDNSNDSSFFNYLKKNLIEVCIEQLQTSQSQSIDNQPLLTIKNTLQETTSKLIKYDAHIDNVIVLLNKPTIFIDEDANKNFFDTTNKNQLIENKFCEKMRKLDKPNKKNLVFKRFSQDIIEKKNNYINKLYKKIEKIHKNQNDIEIYNTNIDRLYSHTVSKNKYDAIVKGIDNIKNRNKVKINLM